MENVEVLHSYLLLKYHIILLFISFASLFIKLCKLCGMKEFFLLFFYFLSIRTHVVDFICKE